MILFRSSRESRVVNRNSMISMTPRGEEDGQKEALAASQSAYNANGIRLMIIPLQDPREPRDGDIHHPRIVFRGTRGGFCASPHGL